MKLKKLNQFEMGYKKYTKEIYNISKNGQVIYFRRQVREWLNTMSISSICLTIIKPNKILNFTLLDSSV